MSVHDSPELAGAVTLVDVSAGRVLLDIAFSVQLERRLEMVVG